MKIKEIIIEAQDNDDTVHQANERENEDFAADSTAAIPGVRKYNQLDTGSPYHSYRFGMALAGAPDYEMPLEGPVGQKMITVAYTDADRSILDATGKSLGFNHTMLTPHGSTEHKDIYTQSPMQPKGPIKRKSK